MAKRSESKKKALPKGLLRQLGKRSDGDLASEFGVPVEWVRRERVSRGMLRTGPSTKWNERALALLGTNSDEKVAEILGLTKTAVFQQRRKRGIPPFGLAREKKSHRWSASELKRLGRVSDSEIARQLGLSQTTVRAKRVSLGIEPVVKNRAPRVWKKSELALLGKHPDQVVAARLKLHRHKVALKRQQLGIPNPVMKANRERWTKQVLSRLGKVSDRQLAEELGVSVTTISGYRYRHGIRKSKSRRSAAAAKGKWERRHVERLGTVPDSVIANDVGVTRSAVAAMRIRLGIQALHGRKK